MPNAALHLPLKAVATQEQRLEAVRCKRLLGREACQLWPHSQPRATAESTMRLRPRFFSCSWLSAPDEEVDEREHNGGRVIEMMTSHPVQRVERGLIEQSALEDLGS